MNNDEPILVRSAFFIGSAVQSLPLAFALKSRLEDEGFEAIVWDDYFRAPQQNGLTFYNTVQRAVTQFVCGIFIAGQDIKLADYREYQYGTSANVWLEYGAFAQELGQGRTILAHEAGTQVASDLNGYNHRDYVWTEADKKGILAAAKDDKTHRYDWHRLNNEQKEELREITKDIAQLAISKINTLVPSTLHVRHLPNRKWITTSSECYSIAKQMIEHAEDEERIYSILSYRNEGTDKGSGETLNQVIISHINVVIDRFSQRMGVPRENLPQWQKGQFSERYKRWINLAHGNLANRATELLSELAGFIDVQDTHCSFFEVVITADKVLITFPGKDHKVDYGLYIQNTEFADRLAESWFDFHAASPLSIIFDTTETVEKYRGFDFLETSPKALTRRMTDDPRSLDNDTGCLVCIKRKFRTTEFSELRMRLRRVHNFTMKP